MIALSSLGAYCLAGGVSSLAIGAARVIDFAYRPIGLLLVGAGLALTATPALADQYKIAADNARVDCIVSGRDLTRISLIGDGFANVSKVSTGYPYNDFSVTNEPVRGDIYLSVPETFAARSLSFFATSKKGFVYKFACSIEGIEAQQIFVTNPALGQADRDTAEQQTPIRERAVSLIQAMAGSGSAYGYDLRQPASAPVRVGHLSLRLIAEYRGPHLSGKVLRLENKSSKPLALSETDLAPEGTLAISLSSSSLAPGAVATAYLVGQKGEGAW